MSKYFTLRGRATRSEYWWYFLMYIIITCAALAFDVYLYDPFQPVSLNPFSYFTSFWLIVNIIPQFTVTVRRLHDTDKSGFWYLINLVPLGWVVMLVFMVLPSDPRDNSYGPPPFGPRGSKYQGHDLDDISLTGNSAARAQEPHNPYAAYAALERSRQPASPEMIAARKEQVTALYQQRVLGRKPMAEGS
ncbi:DUF805 domain-containing protein [Yoonia sp. R2331]|uniref:DUF805 domain-containing protein n=1 Tax=Yoonia sp. R2331 TaxID=3237238 RepID=UPI0034E3BF50